MSITLDQLFTEAEKNELARFVDNKILLEAVKKVILSSVYFDGTVQKDGIPDPLQNFLLAIASGTMGQLTREQLGEKVEASLAGVQLLEQGFRKLEQFGKRKTLKNLGINPAR